MPRDLSGDPNEPDIDGRSDRTLFLLAATLFSPRVRARADAAFRRGQVRVLHGPGAGLRFPARAIPPTHAHAGLIVRGLLDVPVQEALRRTVPMGGTVYDLGAMIGFFTVLAASLVGRSGRVLAFEPMATAAELTRLACVRNEVQGRVEVRCEAVGAETGTANLHEVDAGGIWSHLATRYAHPQTRVTVRVPVRALDDLIAGGAPPPDVMKIDVEGAELDVLRGCSRLLAKHRPIIVCELHGTNAGVADLLEDAGYRLKCLDGPALVRDAGPSHVLARPV